MLNSQSPQFAFGLSDPAFFEEWIFPSSRIQDVQAIGNILFALQIKICSIFFRKDCNGRLFFWAFSIPLQALKIVIVECGDKKWSYMLSLKDMQVMMYDPPQFIDFFLGHQKWTSYLGCNFLLRDKTHYPPSPIHTLVQDPKANPTRANFSKRFSKFLLCCFKTENSV